MTLDRTIKIHYPHLTKAQRTIVRDALGIAVDRGELCNMDLIRRTVKSLFPTPAAPRCVGLARRTCTNPARPDSAYCEECAPVFDALCDGVPPAPAAPSPISITATPSGMYHIRYGATTIGVCSADALEALRLYLAAPVVEAYDDALTTIEELRAA